MPKPVIDMDSSAQNSGGPVAANLVEDLAAASRILAAQGVVDAFGHVSMRHPSAPDRYLMARSIAPALVTPGDIMEYDLDSTLLSAGGRDSFLERFIHGEIYKVRPDVHSVVHSHSPTVIPFSVTGEPLKAISHIASFLANGCPCFEIRDVGLTQGLLVTNNKQGAALAKTLGNNPVALMRGHGNLVVAPDVRRAVHRALYTEVNAQQLATALSFRRPIKYVTEDEAQDPKRLGDSWDVWKAEAMKAG